MASNSRTVLDKSESNRRELSNDRKTKHKKKNKDEKIDLSLFDEENKEIIQEEVKPLVIQKHKSKYMMSLGIVPKG